MGSRKPLSCSEVRGRLAARAALAALALALLLSLAGAQSTLSARGRYTVNAAARAEPDGRMVADITILDKASGETRQVSVPLDWRGDQLEVDVVADRTLIALEQRRYGQAVTVADVLSGAIVDRIVGYKISLTAGKTRAAYLHYFPPHSTMDNVVVVYDFTRSPRENASAGFSSEPLARFTPKGIILFPLENRARLAYQSRSDPVRVVLSPIAWCKDNRIAFLTSTFSVRSESGCQVTVPGSETHLVEMSVPANPWQAKVIAQQVVDPLLVYGLEGRQWPLPGPPPQVQAKELRYSEDCRSITIVPYGDARIVPGAAPIEARPVTLPAR